MELAVMSTETALLIAGAAVGLGLLGLVIGILFPQEAPTEVEKLAAKLISLKRQAEAQAEQSQREIVEVLAKNQTLVAHVAERQNAVEKLAWFAAQAETSQRELETLKQSKLYRLINTYWRIRQRLLN